MIYYDSTPIAIPEDTRRVATYIPVDTAKRLEQIAKREHRTVSNLLRAWLIERVEQERKTKGKRR